MLRQINEVDVSRIPSANESHNSCDVPLTKLLKSKEERTCADILERVFAQPNETFEKDEVTGNTALHTLVQFNKDPSIVLLQALHSANPSMITEKNNWTSKITHQTPVHISAERCSYATNQYFVDVTNSNEKSLEIFTSRDVMGNTPLHLACGISQADPRVVAVIASALDSSYVDMKNFCGKTPLAELSKNYEEFIKKALKNNNTNFPIIDQTLLDLNASEAFLSEAFLDLADRDFLQEFWWKAIALIKRSTLHNGSEKEEWRDLHQLLQLQKVSSRLILLAIKLYPQQIRQPDSRGDYPLHIACRNPHLHLKKLVNLYPNAAKVPNKKGLYPLHLALRLRYERNNRSFDARKKMVSWKYGLESVFLAAKHVVTICDDGMRLYPFMMAAIGNCNKSNLLTDNHDSEGSCCLTTVYILLRHCPELDRFTEK